MPPRFQHDNNRSETVLPTRLSACRRGAASLEVVMTTAVALPIAIGLLILGAQMCRYAYQTLVGMLLFPVL